MGLGLGLTAATVEGYHIPGSVWRALVVLCRGWMVGRLLLEIRLKRVWRFLFTGKIGDLCQKNREKNCRTLEVCCAVQFSKIHLSNLAYQSRGTGDAVICDGDDGRLWSHNSQ